MEVSFQTLQKMLILVAAQCESADVSQARFKRAKAPTLPVSAVSFPENTVQLGFLK